MANSGGRHRARRTRGSIGRTAMVGAAVAGVVTLGLTPTVAAAPSTYFVRGTNIGRVPVDSAYSTWVDHTVGATAGAHDAPVKVEYPGGFWPVSKGYLNDPTYEESVDQGVVSLGAAIVAAGDADTPVIIHGLSQGAVVATRYLRAHPNAGNTYVLVGNPNRPNGGIMQRFNGLHIPFLDISFDGATPTDGDAVIDIAYRYDGWADFPKYPLNVLATANALLGIVFLHGKADLNVNAETLAAAEQSTHGNTTYYLLESQRIPLLMPFDGIVPDQVLDALDRPLRAIIETGYDRDDYGKPTAAALVPSITSSRSAEVAPEPAQPSSEPRVEDEDEEPATTTADAADHADHADHDDHDDDEPTESRRARKTAKRASTSRDAEVGDAETKPDNAPESADAEDADSGADTSPDSDDESTEDSAST